LKKTLIFSSSLLDKLIGLHTKANRFSIYSLFNLGEI